MNWHKFFRPSFGKAKPLTRDLDRRLVNNLRRNYWPSVGQLKYIGRFFNKKEIVAILSSFGVIILALITWGTVFFIRHHITLPQAGGEYTEAMVGQPKMINPIFASANDIDVDLSSLMYSGLFRYDADQKLAPDLAVSYEISEDKKTYTIKLREDAYWSDGEKINADDVVFTFDTIQNPEVNSLLYTAFQGVSVEKVSDTEVHFILKEAFAPFLSSLTVGIIPEHVFGETPPNTLRLAKENLQPKATSGPWRFSKMIKDETGIQSYTLEARDNYYGPKSYLKNISFKFYQDYTQAAEAMHEKDVMGIAFLPQDLAEKYKSKNYVNNLMRIPQYTALFFNQNNQSLLKDSKLRQALAKAIDKKKIIDEALKGQGETIEAPILSGTLGYYADISKITFDIEAANKLLDDAGWTRIEPQEYFKLRKEETLKTRQEEIKNLPDYETNSSTMLADLNQEVEDSVRQEMNAEQTFYRKDKKNNLMTMAITTVDNPEYRAAAEKVASMWRSIGVQTGLQTVSSRQINREILKDRNYEILLYGEILGEDPDPFPFWHSSQADYPGLNLAMFTDRNADKMLEEARVTSDLKQREKLYRDFQDILAKDLPAIFLYTPAYNYLIDEEVQGVKINRVLSPADRFNGLSEWYIKTKWGWK